MVRVGFTGGGSPTGVTRRHAIPVVQELEKLGLAKPFALASRSPYSEWGSYAHDQGIQHTYTDPLLMIHDERVELVYIASIPSGHFPLVGEALAAGKTIIVEKPATLSTEEVAQLRIAVARSRRPFAINLPFLGSPLSYGDFINRVGLHSIGRPSKLSITYETTGRWMDDPSDWHWRPEDGGGVLRDLLPHALSIAACLLGYVPSGRWTVSAQRRIQGIEVEINVHCQMATGCELSLQLAWVPKGFPQRKNFLFEGVPGSIAVHMDSTTWSASTSLKKGAGGAFTEPYKVETSTRLWWVEYWRQFLLGNVLAETCLDIEEKVALVYDLATSESASSRV